MLGERSECRAATAALEADQTPIRVKMIECAIFCGRVNSRDGDGRIAGPAHPPTVHRRYGSGRFDMGLLNGRVAVVTGTSRGVGVGIARELLLEGATVIGCSRSALPAIST